MKLGRNKLCHCGSGAKYKKCCLWKDTHPEPEPEPEEDEQEVKRSRYQLRMASLALLAMGVY